MKKIPIIILEILMDYWLNALEFIKEEGLSEKYLEWFRRKR